MSFEPTCPHCNEEIDHLHYSKEQLDLEWGDFDLWRNESDGAQLPDYHEDGIETHDVNWIKLSCPKCEEVITEDEVEGKLFLLGGWDGKSDVEEAKANFEF